MKLAIFTPGAYIWPVQRSFEGFILSLGCRGHDVGTIAASAAYPVNQDNEPGIADMPLELSQRLIKLHRDLYDALLRPVEIYKREEATLQDWFMPDLKHTTAGQLLDGVMFYFIRRMGPEVSMHKGLSVLRAAFFNHEAADPSLWIHSSIERLAEERQNARSIPVSFRAPSQARVQGLSFALMGAVGLPPTSAGMMVGETRRMADGGLEVSLELGHDPSLGDEIPDHAMSQIKDNAISSVSRVFGWNMESAA